MAEAVAPADRPAEERWRERQEGRGIPPEIVAAAPADPWGHDPRDFRPPEDADTPPSDDPSRCAALALLRAGGTLLDVGCGGGIAGLALRSAVTHLTGVDRSAAMLDVLAAACAHRGLPHRTVHGDWPAVAAEAGRADVVVAHHVLHNVVDLGPFVAALTAAAGCGVVVEMTAEHPMAWLDPLWLRFHGLRRPPSATAADARAVLAGRGIDAAVVRWTRPPRLPKSAAWVARRLCLPADREPEVADALAALPRPSELATLSWRC